MKKGFFKQWRIWLLCLGSLGAGTASGQGSRQSDSLELVALYNATNGSNWANKTNWLTTNPINTWAGVIVDDNYRVYRLNLHSNNLTGNIPNFNLPNLMFAFFNNNQLTGSIPNFNLPNLQRLDLRFNRLTGNIPNFNLPSLQDLWLTVNALTGLPNFNSLPNLKTINLNGNALTGAIPNFNLPNLQSLVLSNCQLSGHIPNFNLPNLRSLELSGNQLTGSIPNFNLPNLQFLLLELNQLEGCIPATIRINCPLIGANNGYLLLNTSLATQNWANYWNNGEGSCRITTSGGTITASQCGNRNFRLPSGRIVNTTGVYADTIIHNTFAQDTAYMITLRADTTCRCLDSIQLVALYTATNGANWTNKTNWLSINPIHTWYGVRTTASGCVDSISLVSNQLAGNLPNLNSPNLKHLVLNNNQLSGNLPSLASCTRLTQVNIANNRFTFLGLPTLVSRNWTTFNYAPQDSIGSDTSLTAYRANQVRLVVPMPHEVGNKYSWYKGTTFITDTTATSQLPLFRLHPADAGTYYCKVTNPNAPQLTLQSRPIRLNVISPFVVNGGTRTDVICSARDYRLPSGRIVNYAGTHQDTIVHLDATIDTAYTIQLRSDSSCHCQDSIALAGMYHASGGFPQNWDLNRPMNTWNGLAFDANGCVTSWADTRPDSVKCMALGGSDTLRPDFGIWELVNAPKKWFRNGIWIATYNGNPLNINQFRQVDSGKYVCRTDLASGQFSLIPTLRSVLTRAYQVRLCCTTTVVQRDTIIRAGSCVNWCGIARCSTGVYTCSTINPNTGCEILQRLNLRVDTSGISVSISQVGNTLSALVSSSRPIVNYRWSNGIHGPDKSSITIQTSGNYDVTVTDDFGTEARSTIQATFDPTLNFRMDSIQLSCTGNGNCTPIILQQPIRNAIGYTIRVNFDTTLLRFGGVYRYNYLMSNDSHYMYPPVIVGNQLVVTFVVTGAATMNGNMGDTLACITWQPRTSIMPSNPVTLLNGWVEESIRNVGGQTNYRVQSQIRIIPTGGLLIWQIGLLATSQNNTTVKIGTPRQMRTLGTASNVAPFQITPFRNETLQYDRHSQRVVGLPDIGGSDCRLGYLMNAGVRTPEILGLTATQIIAADVNGDGLVNAGDLADMESRGTHIVSGFIQNNNALHPGKEQSYRTFPKYHLISAPEYQISYMRYVDSNGIVRYRIPKIDTIFNLNTAYGNRCDTPSVDVQMVLLGDVNGNNQDVRKGKLSDGVTLIIPDTNLLIRRIPIYVKGSFSSIDTKMEGFDANMRILGLEDIHPNLRLVLNTGETDKKSYMLGYTLDGSTITTDSLLIAYLRVQFTNHRCWHPNYFGTKTGYLNSQVVNMNFITCNTKNEDLQVQHVSIFPNPSAGLFTIESSEKLGTIRVYDAIGRLVKTMETIENQLNIDLSDDANGLYMVRIGQQNYKIMKH